MPFLYAMASPGFTVEEINDYADFLVESGIRRFICLLSPKEYSPYADPGLEFVLKSKSIKFIKVNMTLKGAAKKTKRAYEEAAAAREDIAMACSNGVQMTSTAAGALLVMVNGTTAYEAMKEITAVGQETGALREPSVAQISSYVKAGHLP
eukprot:CAMPEP_0184866070 /NCGR_PEP_ID=MMETSP0580-20130426/20626_1 /TAXON_ID=1118495 /ORGANISM="Dactyliosolen fragilissimus" /LENGTH=150 /DNA_ID=CAMNT_0027365535 /DNA_START=145 /DNA_END=597 /DNA_ORIENTATION=-